MTDIRNPIAALAAAALLMAGNAFAAANVQSIRGEVRANNAVLNVNDRVTPGAAITTGPGAQAVLRFDDGQQVVVNENTLLRIVEYRYRADSDPHSDRANLDLLRGSVRVVTGALVAKNRENFQLRLPQATITARGTDFMVAITNPAHFNVLHGAIAVTNASGTAVFGAGSYGMVATSSALPVSLASTAVPPTASAAFSSMGATAGVAAGGMAAGAPPVIAAGGVTTAGVGAVAAVAAGVAVGAALMSEDETTATTHH